MKSPVFAKNDCQEENIDQQINIDSPAKWNVVTERDMLLWRRPNLLPLQAKPLLDVSRIEILG
jgi:hypothetical protein